MPTMSVPERTIDSLFAVEVVRDDPYALIWSPTQYSNSPDHVLANSSGRVAVFECKGVQAVADPDADDWKAKIDVGQLHSHASSSHPILYLVLAKPTNIASPALRFCSKSCCATGKALWCKMCARDARSWGLLEQHVLQAETRLRLQPWFAHWAWVISATDLLTRLTSTGKATQQDVTFKLDDALIETTFPDAARLCHRLHDLRPGSASLGSLTWPPEVAATEIPHLPWEDDGGSTPPICAVIPGD